MKKILALLAMFPGTACIFWFLCMLFQDEATRWAAGMTIVTVVITCLFVVGLAVLFDWE